MAAILGSDPDFSTCRFRGRPFDVLTEGGQAKRAVGRPMPQRIIKVKRRRSRCALPRYNRNRKPRVGLRFDHVLAGGCAPMALHHRCLIGRPIWQIDDRCDDETRRRRATRPIVRPVSSHAITPHARTGTIGDCPSFHAAAAQPR